MHEGRDELGLLCKLGYAQVGKEPIITAGYPTKPHNDEDREGRRGDLVVRGPIASQTDCVIDTIIKVINQNGTSRSSLNVNIYCRKSLRRGARKDKETLASMPRQAC